MKKILFINNADEKCGVYQYGLNISNALTRLKDFKLDYAECSNLDQCKAALQKEEYWAVIYNYHKFTLAFVNADFLKSYPNPIHICLVHELCQEIADQLDDFLFDYYIYTDPTLIIRNIRVFKTGRLLLKYEHQKPVPDIPIIGSYGLGTTIKQYEQLIKAVQNEFDQAVIRLNIVFQKYYDSTDIPKTYPAKLHKLIKKPGIKLEISHHFFSKQELLEFLAENTINIFLYEENGDMGISSALDQALAVKRPIAISDSNFFRHVFSAQPSILFKPFPVVARIKKGIRFLRTLALRCLRKRQYLHRYEVSVGHVISSFFTSKKGLKYNSLREIINNGFAPLEKFYTAWSEEPFLNEITQILNKIEIFETKIEGRKFNRLLDDTARMEYEQPIQEITKLAPEIIRNKIQRANVQQAFVFDTVRHFNKTASNILCIGGFQDTAFYSLEKLGFKMENIDPEINHDLNTFFHLPTTKKEAYDIIFSTSVIEHVENDDLFFSQFVDLLKPGGIGILTCDFKKDYVKNGFVFPGNYRFYTTADLTQRILPSLKNCVLIDEHTWDKGDEDFELAGVNYTFASLVFRKGAV